MKKSVLFALSLALITGAVIPFSSASRNAYHAYITSQQNRDDYRYFSEGRRTANTNDREIIRADFQANNPAYSARFQRNSRVNLNDRVLRAPERQERQIYVEATSRTEVDTQLRPFATRAGVAPWRDQLTRSGQITRVVSTPVYAQLPNFETFENEAFSVQLPVGAQAKAEDAHAFIYGDVDIRIKKFDAGTCSNAFGFKGCATNITRGENIALVGGKGRLIPIDRVVRQTYQTDTVLGAVNQPTDVYTEEFTTEFTTGGQFTLYRYATPDVDGGVFYIEVKIPRQQAAEYVGVVNKMFDSFRIYTTQ